jgi:hypothetical protein
MALIDGGNATTVYGQNSLTFGFNPPPTGKFEFMVKTPLTDIDGGFSRCTYVAQQVIDGGGA